MLCLVMRLSLATGIVLVMFQAEAMKRTCSESLLVPEEREILKPEVPQSIHRLKCETEMSQLTFRPVTVNALCFIQLILGMVSSAANT